MSGAPATTALVQPTAWRWWMLALFIAGADLLTKAVVQTMLPYGASVPVTNFFNLVHVWNTGAAFSVLADAGGWQRYVLTSLALAVSVWLIWVLRKPHRFTEALAFSLILGGALGNALDRLLRGHVVDFLDFHWYGWHWPAFNVADVGISIGATLLVFTVIAKSPPRRSA